MARSTAFLCASLGIALLAAPQASRAVATQFTALETGAVTEGEKIQIFATDQPDQVVEEREVQPGGAFTLDLDGGRQYGARTEGGPTLATFRGGDDVSLDLGPALIPSAYVGFGMSGSFADGDVLSTFGAQGSGSGNLLSPAFFFGGELAGPPCGCFPGNPRPFFHVGTSVLTDRDSKAAEGGVFGSTGLADVTAQMRGNWYAGFGTTFTLPCGEREFQIKPSINYVGERVRIRGRIDEEFFIPGARFRADNSATYHGVAPKLSIETQVARRDNWAVNLYTSGMVSFFPDTDREQVRVQGVGGDADVFWDRNTVSFMVGGGIRLSWLGCGLCGDDD